MKKKTNKINEIVGNGAILIERLNLQFVCVSWTKVFYACEFQVLDSASAIDEILGKFSQCFVRDFFLFRKFLHVLHFAVLKNSFATFPVRIDAFIKTLNEKYK